jgi:hypothetical protein
VDVDKVEWTAQIKNLSVSALQISLIESKSQSIGAITLKDTNLRSQ